MVQRIPTERFSSLERHPTRTQVHGDPTFKTSGSTFLVQTVTPHTSPSMVQLHGLTNGTLRSLKQENTRLKSGQVTATSVTTCKGIV